MQKNLSIAIEVLASSNCFHIYNLVLFLFTSGKKRLDTLRSLFYATPDHKSKVFGVLNRAKQLLHLTVFSQ